mgnify:FL=1
MRKIILASSSIHRKKLLKQIKLNFIAISPDIDESRNKNESVNKFVKRLSIEKAMKIAVLRKNSIVIGSDEIAVVDDKIITTAHYKDMGPWMKKILEVFYNQK